VAGPAIRQVVLKVHSRCNLACDYCYVYESVDQSWKLQPTVMARHTVELAAKRLAEHATEHGLPQVWVTLHGGEPLMIGLSRLRDVVQVLREAFDGSGTDLEIGMQTNGVLLDRRIADFALAEGLRIGISLDGGREANDRHRTYAHGGSSYEQVAAAARLMAEDRYRPVYAGILATIDPANDPVQLFHDLQDLRPGRTDLLLPHATWEHPPPGTLPGRTVYGDWLVAFFDAWYDAPPVIGVRVFEEIMHTLLGGASAAEAVGLSAPTSIVIETDGSFERSDILKVTYAGAPETGYTVVDHSLDDVLRHPAMRGAMSGRAALSPTCQECPIVQACGGGLYPHRYRPGHGFANPSVYCRDLGRIINHISDRMQADLAARREQAAARRAPALP